MFEEWPVAMDPPTRRVVDPPTPVVVDLAKFIPNPGDAFRRDGIAMRIKAEGLDFRDQVPGQLHAWAQSTAGGWLALVSCSIPTGNGRGKLTVSQWCPASAVSPIGNRRSAS